MEKVERKETIKEKKEIIQATTTRSYRFEVLTKTRENGKLKIIKKGEIDEIKRDILKEIKNPEEKLEITMNIMTK